MPMIIDTSHGGYICDLWALNVNNPAAITVIDPMTHNQGILFVTPNANGTQLSFKFTKMDGTTTATTPLYGKMFIYKIYQLFRTTDL